MKVCIFTSAHSCSDGRIFHKEAKTLAAAGYDVVMIGQHDKEEVAGGVRIVPLPRIKSRLKRFTIIWWMLLRLSIQEKASVYHFHDPDLIPLGLLLKALGKKVVYDVHELVYFQIADKDWLKFAVIKMMAQRIYYIFEKVAVKVFDQVILAEDGYLDYFRRQHGSSIEYLTIRNFACLGRIDAAAPEHAAEKTKPVVIYAGGLSEVRGVLNMVKAMGFLKGSAELWLLGKWDSEKLRADCEAQNGWEYCRYFGMVTLDEVYSYVKKADIGISVLYPVENYLTSLPTKAFEYMACRIPMVMSDFPYWKKVFGECAVYADPAQPQDIAKKVIYLVDNPEEAGRLGRQGRELVEKEYTWETESNKLLDLYRRLSLTTAGRG